MKKYLLILLIALAGGLEQVSAQAANRSDFNVPPPLAPASTTKGNMTGKTTSGKPPVLTLSNLPSFGVPSASSAAQLPELAAIGISAPVVSQPEQPMASAVIAGLPEIPVPATPETPAMPKRTLQDTPLPAMVDIPVPDAPDLPDFPKEPATTGGLPATKGTLPLMPDIFGAFELSIPSEPSIMTWSIPGIPENTGFKLLLPAGSKGLRSGSQGNKKAIGGALKTQ